MPEGGDSEEDGQENTEHAKKRMPQGKGDRLAMGTIPCWGKKYLGKKDCERKFAPGKAENRIESPKSGGPRRRETVQY